MSSTTPNTPSPADPKSAVNLTPDAAPVAEMEYTHSAFEEWLRERKKQLIVVGSLLGLGFLGYYTFDFYRQAREKSAGEAFAAATRIDDFREVAKNHAGRLAGGNAAFTVAQMQFEDSRVDQAIAEWEKFVADYPQHPLVEQAKFRLAESALKKNDTQGALQKFRDFVASYGSSSLKSYAQQRIGDILAKQGQTAEARTEYEKIRTVGNDASNEIAKKRLENLEQEAPVKIPFKEDPPAPAAAAGTPTPGGPSLTPPSTELSSPSLSLTPGAGAPNPTIPSVDLSTPSLTTPAAPEAPVPAVPAPAVEPK